MLGFFCPAEYENGSCLVAPTGNRLSPSFPSREPLKFFYARGQGQLPACAYLTLTTKVKKRKLNVHA